MNKYLFHIAYKGSQYAGWQRQLNTIGIQEVIENTLEKILRSKTIIHGCGRTDTGVHASQYFFHCHLETEPNEDFSYILNKNLPDDISIFDITRISDQFNAQKSAIKRTYRYYCHTIKDPFLSETSTLLKKKPDFALIKEALPLIKEANDFIAFTLTPDRQDYPICSIEEIELVLESDERQFYFTFTADHFSRGMVRALSYFLLRIGEEGFKLSDFEKALFKGIRNKHQKLAYPQGLYLSKVYYENMNFNCMGKMPF